MNKHILICLSLYIFVFNLNAKRTELDSILAVLDKTIAEKEVYVEQKELRIKDLKQLLDISNITPEQSYDINTKLYNEYKQFIPDSAKIYLLRNIDIARKLENEVWLYDSRLNLSYLYSIAGMYIDAEKTLKSIQAENLSGELLVKYYDASKQLYYYYPPTLSSRREYDLLRDSLLALLNEESYFYKIIYSEKLIHAGKYEEARAMLLPMYRKADSGSHWQAVLAFSLGETYQNGQDYETRKKYYAVAAIIDIKNVIKENAAIRALAIACHETNDIERAYRYIRQSMEDAVFSNARLRTIEVSQIFPIIEKSYQHKLEAQKKRLFFLITCIGLLSVFLIAAVVYVYVQLRRLEKVRRSLADANKQLHALNEDLHASNRQMAAINKELSEANLLKETYITQFLDICSMYINKLETYRMTLNKKARERKLDELFQMLKSQGMIENERKELYEIFDHIFLHLYPNFVDEFNSLLIPEERIELKNNELLKPELRIFALIRLGITDSAKIAQFLNYSDTTIYNYRTRVRNKSAAPREEFENRVMKIGIISK